MQELVLITECVRMHLPHQISPATLNSSPCFNGTQKNWLGVLLCPRQAVDYRQVWTIMEIFQSMYLHWEVWLTARLERVWETNHLETMIMCPSNQVCRGCSIVLCIRDRYVVFPRANANNTKWYQVVKVLVCCYLIESLQMSIDLLAHKLWDSQVATASYTGSVNLFCTLLLLQCIQRSKSAIKYKLNWSILEKSRTTFLSANQFREKKAEQRLDMESVDNQPDLYLE